MTGDTGPSVQGGKPVRPRIVRLAAFVARDPGVVTEVITLVGVAAILVLYPIVGISQGQLTGIVVGLLGVFALSGLLERLTRLRRVDANTEDIRAFLDGGELQNRLRQELEDSLPLVRRCRESGLSWVNDSLTEVDIAQRFGTARAIRILQTWTGNAAGLKEALRMAAGAGCDVRILLLHPDSPQAAYRSRAMGHHDNHAADAIRVDLRILAQLCADPATGGRVRVGLYDAIPAFSMFAFDHTRIVSFFFRGWYTMESPQFTVVGDPTDSGRRSRLAERIDGHFDSLWTDQDTVFLAPSESGEISFATRAH